MCLQVWGEARRRRAGELVFDLLIRVENEKVIHSPRARSFVITLS